MENTDILKWKKILVVDDDPDILEIIKILLDICHIDTALNFETGSRLLDQNRYDIVILDIMGVSGYELLEIAIEKGIPALMLTAHALSPDNFAKSISKGAKAYIPKENISDIHIYLSDLLKAQEGKEKPLKWFLRLRSFFNVKFGKDWFKEYRELYHESEKKYGPFDEY